MGGGKETWRTGRGDVKKMDGHTKGMGTWEQDGRQTEGMGRKQG